MAPGPGRGWRGPILAVLVTSAVGLGLGLAGGYAAGLVTPPERSAADIAQPLPAETPSVPVDPSLGLRPEPAYPPLGVDLAYERSTIGVAPYKYTFLTPVGWVHKRNGPAEGVWTPPGDLENSYLLRVELVLSQRKDLAESVQARIDDLMAADGPFDFNVLSHGDDTLQFSWVTEDRYQRLTAQQWVSTRRTGVAEVEVAAAGRFQDEVGLQAMLERVSASVSR